jgi:hypothetical protein
MLIPARVATTIWPSAASERPPCARPRPAASASSYRAKAFDFQNLPTKTAASTRSAARPASTAWMSVMAEGITWSAASASPGASSKANATTRQP